MCNNWNLQGIIRMDSTDVWSKVGNGLVATSFHPAVRDMAIYNSDLIACGRFKYTNTPSGQLILNNIGRWDGSEWHAMGNGIAKTISPITTSVNCMDVDSINNILYIGSNVGVYKWNGSVMDSLPQPPGYGVSAIKVFNGEVYIGIFCSNACPVTDTIFCKWNGTQWQPIWGLWGFIRDFDIFDNSLVVAGDFVNVSDSTMRSIARYFPPPVSTGNNISIEEEKLFKIFPNPTNSELKVEARDEGEYFLKLQDMKGREIFSTDFRNNISINTENFSKGIYFVSIRLRDKSWFTEKVVVE